MSEQTKSKGECLHPAHKTKARARGLCASCYSVACKLVKEGKTTWEILERAGKALKADPKKQTAQAWLLEANDDPEASQTAGEAAQQTAGAPAQPDMAENLRRTAGVLPENLGENG